MDFPKPTSIKRSKVRQKTVSDTVSQHGGSKTR